MLHTLPGNQLEVLVEPLARLLAVPVDNALEPDVILVQNPGMQHWLSMQLAQHRDRRISMNLRFPLPVTEFWTLIRRVLGPDAVPEASPYRREVLSWRLDALLAREDIAANPTFAEPTRYWQRQSDRQQAVRRHQLAEQLADLYEQYLLYRPDWIADWDSGNGNHWQAQLWRLLTADTVVPHPIKLARQAIDQLAQPAEALPERLFLFGINALSPFWLDFIKALSDQGGIDIHLLYLNPSDDYWGEVVSERQAAKQRARWIEAETDPDTPLDVGNPLLANLGQQGQAFVRLLSERADLETPVFVENETPTLLAQLQRDILHLRDGRDTPSELNDNSISVTRAHSALREVQGLHDWLLHRFNDDPTLTPKDVVVMCPNVEDYAPFVEAVFARRFEDLSEKVPPLPCSIADRHLKDADPTVAAFLDLLTLPDARFQVSQVIGWLRVPAIQTQFQLTPDDVDQLAHWLSTAAVHWGLDAEHKAGFVEREVSDHFTWQQGLDRLLLGFAWGDEATILGERLLLPQVEGSDALQLGRLMAFVRRLKQLAAELNQPRDIEHWQAFLKDRLRLALFATGESFDPAHDDLRTAIADLGQHCFEAGFDGDIPLGVIRDVLMQAFSGSQSGGRQFLTGQITVCSLVPMRSIPFKVLAVLGLNDGEFPRHRPPLGFDLMANDHRLGDRSRRGDDRYLFLEALLSARDAIYLSYQGRDVTNNTERQPSLVLTELFDYLHSATGWRREQIRDLPLQPFAAANYQGAQPSFDRHWLRLTAPLPDASNIAELPEPDWPDELPLKQLIDALDHPSRAFARQRLGLFLGYDSGPQLDDSEPFAPDHLTRYQLQAQLIDSELGLDDMPVESWLDRARLSGLLPDHAEAEDDLQSWQQQAEQFAAHLMELGSAELTLENVETRIDGQQLSAQLPRLADGRLLFWRLADAKGKDYLTLWLHHLVANLSGPTETLGLYRTNKTDAVYQLQLAPLDADDAKTELTNWLRIWKLALCRPLPLNSAIGVEIAKPRTRGEYQPYHFDRLWYGDQFRSGLGSDAYMHWFWPEPPDEAALRDDLLALYEPLFAHLQETAHA
ncbi:exodeoxyribonuclease V subunit gamma [Saccharospirillum sp. HFRX-1]|uniref:exodeoxyribonuclease V subunit gamma n=1 Tax=unclassified Saccharospirillum TaxID=2633430 RepID=UPI00371E47DB